MLGIIFAISSVRFSTELLSKSFSTFFHGAKVNYNFCVMLFSDGVAVDVHADVLADASFSVFSSSIQLFFKCFGLFNHREECLFLLNIWLLYK